MNNDISIAEIVVGDVTLTFEIPTSLFKTISLHAKSKEINLYSHNAVTIIEILRGLIPEDVRPPTQRQESYVRTMSKSLNLVVSDDVFNSVVSCSEFIDLHSDQYQLLKDKDTESKIIKKYERDVNKRLISQANKVNKWLLVKEMLASKVKLDKVAMEFGVKPVTIEKYLIQLKDWESESLFDGSRETVMNFVYRLRDGEDLYDTHHKTYYSES